MLPKEKGVYKKSSISLPDSKLLACLNTLVLFIGIIHVRENIIKRVYSVYWISFSKYEVFQ